MPSALRLILLCVASTLAAGCGEAATSASGGLVEQACRLTPEGYTVCEPASPLPPGATPPPPPTELVASEQALAGVALGTPAETAEARLTAELGAPQVEEHSCQRLERRESLDVPLRGERLTWDTLAAYTTTMPSGERLLTGWAVMTPLQEPWPYDVQLPYGVRLTAPVQDVLRQLPQARSQVPPDGRDAGRLIISTPDFPALVVISDDPDGSGEVDTVAYDPEGCR